ncbi:NAD-glutamate dehydrogenase domain-containing protein [Gordonia iterans]
MNSTRDDDPSPARIEEPPAPAADHLTRLDRLAPGEVDVNLASAGEEGEGLFTLYAAGARVALSDVLPLLHSLGVRVVDERPHSVVRPDGDRAWIYDFTLSPSALPADPARVVSAGGQTVGERFGDAFLAAWRGSAEVDQFNRLVLTSGLHWREVELLRGYAKYLGQARFPYSAQRIAGVLAEHPEMTQRIVALFRLQFAPGQADPDRAEVLVAELLTAIDEVASLDVDRILRAYLDLVRATLRTNYFRRLDDSVRHSSALALKFSPSLLGFLPAPRPRIEVYVYSPRVEGVHFRYGPVARGGLRWSDRLEDFRTEVLGLVKAQAVKNAVIVPVGAKGGFVSKRPPAATGDSAADREAFRAEGVACYRTFIAALLDLTDDVDPRTGVTVPPPLVVCRDPDDTYLVVAADKGTASFSDEANDVAARYGYWLGDAFASGGSVGYDHKGMGITAKGAWESVKRHFRELSLDPQSEDVTVAGIGDMSGDVFGNGMLMSPHIRLVAAFDHRHVFVDPDPDAARSFAERRRLFGLPRSSWADYDPALISPGGGVFPRSAKSIEITGEVRRALGIDDDVVSLTPTALIRAVLQAPVDLLWNGGIGTYVRASAETDLDVGDKANDAVRVAAPTVRARVIGEGGNLGVTPRGRVEVALAGGCVNTDALDNSAGVDCSDHEVNIKVLLDGLVSAGAVSPDARDALLVEMTDDVEQLVLRQNYSQNELVGTCRAAAAGRFAVHTRQIRQLEAKGALERDLEALPDDAEITARAARGVGLVSPELAVLIAHVKLDLKAALLESTFVDSEFLRDRLTGSFPHALRTRHPEAITAHPLRREILATVLANEVVDVGGVSYVFRICEDTGASAVDATRAFVAASSIVGVPDRVARIRETAPSVAVSNAMMSEVRRLVDRVARWLLDHRPQPLAVGAETARYAVGMTELMPTVLERLQGADAAIVDERSRPLIDAGADPVDAREVMSVLMAFPGLDIIDLADIAHCELDRAADVYYALNAHLSIDHLLTAISALDDTERWNALARLALRDDVYRSVRALTLDVLTFTDPDAPAAERIGDWEATNGARLGRTRAVLDEIARSGVRDLAALSVAAQQIRGMVSRGPVSSSGGSSVID